MTTLAPGLRLVVGPPASGKTARSVEVALEACRSGRRVWWIALPHQRPYVFRRVTAGGRAVLGLEVVGAQQAYYRVLSAAASDDLRPLVVGTARIVVVAEALRRVMGREPSPGEAKLFAAAIAEAKRYEVPPEALRGLVPGAELERLTLVYEAYEEAKRGHWDYDDVRSEAARLAGSGAFAAAMGAPDARSAAGLPDAVVVDGWRELGPLDWVFLRGLARHVPVHVALPHAPPGLAPDEVLAPDPAAVELRRYAAVNAVDEARWVLRSLKRDLAEGLDPLDLAVVAPGGAGDALAALADEYGVPLMDERGVALTDTPAGRALLALLELRGAPTPARLLAVPELAPVAATALRLGVTGGDALERVARAVGLGEALARWTELLAVSGDPVAWTRWLLNEVLALTQEVDHAFRERVLAAAQHASRLGGGERFQAWLAALLRDVSSPRTLAGGVALLNADLASGRRFERCYVMGATVGAYSAGEREDYFVPDDVRAPVRSVGCLPRRFAGGDDLVVAELLTRGRVTVVTAPLAGPDGALVPDERLAGDPASLAPLPVLPAGSLLEVGPGEPYEPAFEPLPVAIDPPRAPDGGPDVEWLREYAEECALRAWGELALDLGDERLESAGAPADAAGSPRAVERELRRLLEEPPGGDADGDWEALLAALKAEPSLSPARLASIAASHPWAAEWLRDHAGTLTCLSWNAKVSRRELGVSVYLDAARRLPLGRSAQKVAVYRFVAPTRELDRRGARDLQRGRWTEYVAGPAILNHSKQGVQVVEVWVWPVLGEPVWVEDSQSDFVQERFERVERGVRRALDMLSRGRVEPNPDEYRCKRCRLAAVCRQGELP
ncbi:MAG TPA: hypothetical protein VF202_12405 [Trueperaceae bacterium]